MFLYKKLYIQLFSIHGLFRAHNLELGHDADNGGQIRYVFELAAHLSTRKEVAKVDLFTRLVSDPSLSETYSQSVEKVNEKFRIIRIPCGGAKYLKKEELWPHLNEYADNVIKFIQRQNTSPDLVFGHYADAGYVAMQISDACNIPFVFTAHSLGRIKKKLFSDNLLIPKHWSEEYIIDQRIEVEEVILKNADLIIASTSHEIEKQYELYRNKNKSSFQIIRPGFNRETFFPYHLGTSEVALIKPIIINHLSKPDKPLILSLSRLDRKKNLAGLVQAYGQDSQLQDLANLALILPKNSIANKASYEAILLADIIALQKQYDLFGKVAILPICHGEKYVAEFYRYTAQTRGIFVNPALDEPFGLTSIESSATGLPIVVTDEGGSTEILKLCLSGTGVDSKNKSELCGAIKQSITNAQKWQEYSHNGMNRTPRFFSWDTYTEAFLSQLEKLRLHKRRIETPPRCSGCLFSKTGRLKTSQ